MQPYQSKKEYDYSVNDPLEKMIDLSLTAEEEITDILSGASIKAEAIQILAARLNDSFYGTHEPDLDRAIPTDHIAAFVFGEVLAESEMCEKIHSLDQLLGFKKQVVTALQELGKDPLGYMTKNPEYLDRLQEFCQNLSQAVKRKEGQYGHEIMPKR